MVSQWSVICEKRTEFTLASFTYRNFMYTYTNTHTIDKNGKVFKCYGNNEHSSNRTNQKKREERKKILIEKKNK